MTQADSQLIEDLTIVLSLAREAAPQKSHSGSCTTETNCDMDCASAYYCGMAIGRVQLYLNKLKEQPDDR